MLANGIKILKHRGKKIQNSKRNSEKLRKIGQT